MEGKKVCFFEIEPWEERFLRDKLHTEREFQFYSDRLSDGNIHLAQEADVLVTFIYSDLSLRILDKLPKLKGIVTMSVGTDHIDTKEAERRGITICNVPSYGPNTVAEHAMALLLALSRNIIPSVERTRAGDYDYTGLSGWDLLGRTIGVIGTGKIGALVVKASHGFGMRIVAYDPIPNPELTKQYQAEYLSLPEILRRADILSLHVPLTEENKHMLGHREFAQMKRGMVLINTARGGLVDIDALLWALEEGIVKQVGADVLEEEDLIKEEKELFSRHFNLKEYQTALAGHVLMHHPKVLVTPHNAFNSHESLRNILETTIQDLRGLLSGDPINVVESKR